MRHHAGIKFISIMILVGIMLPYFSAFALIEDIEGIGQCTLRSTLLSVLKDLVKAALKAIGNAIRSAACKALSTITLGFVKCPEKTQEDSRTGDAIQISLNKEMVEDIIERCIARQALSRMSRGVLTIVRKQGRDGKVTWVQNWRDFQLNAQHRGEGIFRGILASTNICSYFRDGLKNTFGANQTINLSRIKTRTEDFDSFQVRAGCTLPNNFDFEAYKQNFSGNGGWEAWSRLLEPQNNFYGSLFLSLDEADRQRSLEESADINQVIANKGFLGISGENAEQSCLQADDAGECLEYAEIKTPGSVLADSASQAAFESEFDWLVSVDEISEFLLDMFFTVTSRLNDLSADDPETPPIELTRYSVGGDVPNIGFDSVCDPSVDLDVEYREFVRGLRTTWGIARELAFGNPIFRDRARGEKILFPFLTDAIEGFSAIRNSLLESSAQTGVDVGNAVIEINNVIQALEQLKLIWAGRIDAVNQQINAISDALFNLAIILGDRIRNSAICPKEEASSGGGICQDKGGIIDYENDVTNANNLALDRNPTLANSPNIDSNRFAFISEVVQVLRSLGFNATDRVLNGNDNPNTGDIIGVWRDGDTTMERYDVLRGRPATIGEATAADYTGDIPLTCTQ